MLLIKYIVNSKVELPHLIPEDESMYTIGLSGQAAIELVDGLHA